jgi:hypothetical protein
MMLADKPGGPGFQDAVVNGPVQDTRDGIELALISDDRVVEPEQTHKLAGTPCPWLVPPVPVRGSYLGARIPGQARSGESLVI